MTTEKTCSEKSLCYETGKNRGEKIKKFHDKTTPCKTAENHSGKPQIKTVEIVGTTSSVKAPRQKIVAAKPSVTKQLKNVAAKTVRCKQKKS